MERLYSGRTVDDTARRRSKLNYCTLHGFRGTFLCTLLFLALWVVRYGLNLLFRCCISLINVFASRVAI